MTKFEALFSLENNKKKKKEKKKKFRMPSATISLGTLRVNKLYVFLKLNYVIFFLNQGLSVEND